LSTTERLSRLPYLRDPAAPNSRDLNMCTQSLLHCADAGQSLSCSFADVGHFALCQQSADAVARFVTSSRSAREIPFAKRADNTFVQSIRPLLARGATLSICRRSAMIRGYATGAVTLTCLLALSNCAPRFLRGRKLADDNSSSRTIESRRQVDWRRPSISE